MRFFADGPWLPDALLVASDEGRVLFFCGAGVSREKAGLPDFLGLAKSVLGRLHVLPESPAQKLVEITERLERIDGVGGIIAADRIFGLLEREFPLTEIEHKVGATLKPPDEVDLSAHRTLVTLSRNAGGKVKLVTTNFDRLFEKAAPTAPLWTPNHLPEARRKEDFHGIVHLHGLFDPAYEKPVGGGLVLSSSEFGRAYLVEGWATDFILSVIRDHTIVFVGYAADDPPVQYLLEALHRVADVGSNNLFAFQAGREEDVRALWAQKGVCAIAYTAHNDHSVLWKTLDAWSSRARDPNRWRARLISRAAKGPAALQPYERGQIVHLAMTEDGARNIAEAESTVSASWLCVFDPATRYAQPSKANPLARNSPDVDPFTAHGLDSDPLPPVSPPQVCKRREVPAGAVDVFAPNPLDRRLASGRLTGDAAFHASELPPRLAALAIWLRRICGEPAALWWASGQAGLHPTVVHYIEAVLNYNSPALPPIARSGWRYLFQAWAGPPELDYHGYALRDAIARDGWNTQHLRRFAELSRPRLRASRPFWSGPLPPRTLKWSKLRNVLNLDIDFIEGQPSFTVPDDQLSTIIPLLRQNLEFAVDLYREVNPTDLPRIAPIEPIQISLVSRRIVVLELIRAFLLSLSFFGDS